LDVESPLLLVGNEVVDLTADSREVFDVAGMGSDTGDGDLVHSGRALKLVALQEELLDFTSSRQGALILSTSSLQL
jgi:hypothetical protein